MKIKTNTKSRYSSKLSVEPGETFNLTFKTDVIAGFATLLLTHSTCT